MGLPEPVKYYTPHGYYDLERGAAYKSDYYAGEIWAMPGGSSQHSHITGNLIREVGHRLKGGPCVVYESNLRLKIPATGLRTYPDLSVYCTPLEGDEDDSQGETVTNPTVLFEVLSPSAEAYDRGLKSEHYRQLDSLRAYVLVSQADAHVEIVERQADAHVEIVERQADDGWVLREARGPAATLPIPPLGIELPLAEVYDRVTFDPPARVTG